MSYLTYKNDHTAKSEPIIRIKRGWVMAENKNKFHIKNIE